MSTDQGKEQDVEAMNLTLDDEQATRRLASAMAGAVEAPLCVYLSGDLGAGKTALVRWLLGALGHRGLVKSPTYGLVEHYQVGDLNVVHADLYRLTHAEELEFLGVRDWLSERATLLLVEWPERGAGGLPAADIHLALQHAGGDRRQVTMTAQSPAGDRLLARLRADDGPN